MPHMHCVGVELSNLTSLAGYNEDPINISISGVTNGGLLLEHTGHVIGLNDESFKCVITKPLLHRT